MNMFSDIMTLDESEQVMVTLEMLEKTVCSIKKISETSIENKEFEEIIHGTLDVMTMFRDQIMKRPTTFKQEKWPVNPTVSIITDTVTKCEVCIILYYFD